MLWEVTRIKYIYRMVQEDILIVFEFYGLLCAARTSSWQFFLWS